ncbi:MAG: phosphate transport system ATP-binding protein [Erysipelotrichaceae bacterium]|nr:MAG: phosphate transport system ATP-binding [Erysipelotrichaceae bacterium]TXT19245.1 MAG: phosphate transport system ATP-binding protein [Erysipelotrichaceae bacterium]
MQTKIRVENLNFYYGNFQALKNISMEIYENKITALIGPSGCGKSTFIKSINRMYDLIDGAVAKGSISFDEIEILDKNTDVVELRKRIGMVFQKPNPFPKSITENVLYGVKRHGDVPKIEWLALLESSLKKASLFSEVEHKLNQSAFSLSGGQQQRLCIARTLATKPEVLLMDEPTSALDPIATAKIEELLEELKKEYTVIIVTHSMQQAARISDYTGFFLNGELIEFGLTKTLFSTPKDKRTEDYITGRFG